MGHITTFKWYITDLTGGPLASNYWRCGLFLGVMTWFRGCRVSGTVDWGWWGCAFLGCCGRGTFQGSRGHPCGCCGSEVVAFLVSGLLWQVVLAEGAFTFASFGVIVLSLICGLVSSMGCGCGGVVLVSFFFWEISMVESQSTRCWASAMGLS